MNSHPELEQLSAYADGELDASEAAHIEAHLPECAECRATLAAVRATVTDLALLAEPSLDADAIAALDERIAAERIVRRAFARRWGWVSGAAAAGLVAIVAVLAVVQPGSKGDQGAELGVVPAAVGGGGMTDTAGTTDYTEESLAQALAAYGSGQALTAKTTNAEAAPGMRQDSSYSLDAASGDDRLSRCAAQIESKDADAERFRQEHARFKGQDALLLFYRRPRENSTHVEVWVLRPSDCYTLYFAQSRI